MNRAEDVVIVQKRGRWPQAKVLFVLSGKIFHNAREHGNWNIWLFWGLELQFGERSIVLVWVLELIVWMPQLSSANTDAQLTSELSAEKEK